MTDTANVHTDPILRIDPNASLSGNLPSNVVADMSSSLVQPLFEESVEFANLSKGRFRRRLKDRWHCQVPDHTHCFVKADRTHISLSEDAIERWVSALHNGEATLLIPPKDEFQMNDPLMDSDVASLRSSSTIQYQRPFRSQSNPSLTDLRSLQARLRGSISPSPNSIISTSTASSGIPGIGYLSGKVVKWVGSKILDGVAPLVIIRRRRVINNLINKLEEMPQDDLLKWVFSRQRKINRAVEDLLELTSEQYKAHYRKIAIDQGDTIRTVLIRGPRRFNSEEYTCLSMIFIKLFPLFLLANDSSSSDDFAFALRETVLQEASEFGDEEPFLREIAIQLCFELAYGTQSPWRDEGYAALCEIYSTLYGSRSLQNLGRTGPLIDNLATATFANAPQMRISEHSRAVRFFATYGNDVPEYRVHVLSSRGIPLLVEHLKSISTGTNSSHVGQDLYDLCFVFAQITQFLWCATTLVQCDLCLTLVELLPFIHRRLGANSPFINYYLIWALRNMAFCCGRSGRQAILGAANNLKPSIPHVSDSLRGLHGDMAVETQRIVAEIVEILQ